MKPKEIYDAMDAYAPFALSKEYMARGMHDNSGLLLDCGREITGILFSLDLSSAAIEEAEKRGYNCIVTHHPAVWTGLMRLTEEDAPHIVSCLRAGISVLSAHLNLDAAQGGIDESLMHGLGGETPIAVMEELTGGGYGRVYDVAKTPLKEYAQRVEETFCTKRLIVYGDRPVKRVASFCGAGFNEAAIAFALLHGADTIVSSDGKHHLVAEAAEKGLNVLLLTHYAAENYGFMRFARSIEKTLGIPCAVFTDGRLL